MSLEIRSLKLALRPLGELGSQGDTKEIIHDLSLTINLGEVHVIMGPNGSGKSSLAQALVGSLKYEVRSGEILMDGENVLEMKPDERARAGLFLGWQYPREIEGVRLATFLKAAYEAKSKFKVQNSKLEYKPLLMIQFTKILEAAMDELRINKEFAYRYLNHGLS